MMFVISAPAAGETLPRNTAAIQKAIDAGGMVFLPPGVYLSGTLYLRSNGGLDKSDQPSPRLRLASGSDAAEGWS